jgi:hypothetical protein
VKPSDTTYEWLRTEIASIDNAPDPRNRRLVWVTPKHTLALARDAEGRLELFIAGDPLVANHKVVSQLLEHQVWTVDDGSELAASRLVLPTGEHFDQLGALLCVELVDHGVQNDPQSAFSAVESLIALALNREMVTDWTLIGLIGELALLESLLVVASPTSAPALLRSWAGSTPSARDFQFGSVGVEVKTTQGAVSVHHMEGVHQVELGHANDGGVESELHLLSLGIGWVGDPSQGRSLPELVDSILERLTGPDDQQDLLARIKQYGGDAALGYDHARDRTRSRYAARFYFRFERLYDLCDDRLKLLTSAQLSGLKNIDPGSVTFRIVLEDRVRGLHNPVSGWQALVPRILRASGIEVG